MIHEIRKSGRASGNGEDRGGANLAQTPHSSSSAFLAQSHDLSSAPVETVYPPAGSRRQITIELDYAYRRAIRKLEKLPQNRSGADKSWVEHACHDWRKHYERAVQVR